MVASFDELKDARQYVLTGGMILIIQRDEVSAAVTTENIKIEEIHIIPTSYNLSSLSFLFICKLRFYVVLIYMHMYVVCF